jgi:O-antigen/teichoic acid export membrane protein
VTRPIVSDQPIPAAGGDFAGFLRSAGLLAVARQLSALFLIGVVFVLPALATRAVATDFVWSYFAMLTLSSLLGIGLERLAGLVAASRGDEPLSRSLAPVLLLRIMSVPVVAVALGLLLRFVGVDLTLTAWAGTLLWSVAGLCAPILFGGLRTAGNSRIEPTVMVVVRSLQAVTLAALAVSGASVELMVIAVAVLEWIGVLVAARAVGNFGATRGAWTRWKNLPLRQALALAGIDIVGILNLRADLLLVGHILGAARGATYGLLYRVVDGFNGVVGSAGLWLYAESANVRDGGANPQGIRARSLWVLPRFGLALAAVVVVCAGAAAEVVPRIAEEVDTLRILAVAFPLLSVNAVELHVRSGRGRNRELLWIQSVALAVNLPMCIAAIHAFGRPGAAGALALSELLIAGLLWLSASRDERSVVTPALVTAVLGALLLLLTAAAIGSGLVVLTLLGLFGVVGLIARGIPTALRARLVTS